MAALRLPFPHRFWTLVLLLGAACSASPATTDAPLAADLPRWPDAPRHLERTAADDAPASDATRRDGPAVDQQLPPGLQGLTLFVNLGDSLAAGYYASAGHSYKALLVKNDDVLYPACKGKDLTSLFPAVKVVDRSKSGATTTDAVAQAQGVAPNPAGNTLVVISAGGNDFNDNPLTMVDPAKTTASAQKATANLQLIVDHFRDAASYPGKVLIVMLNVYDPSDGTGNIPARSGLSGFCTSLQKLGFLVGPLMVQNLASFDQALGGFAAQQAVLLADNHAAFLGHGYHFDDPKCPVYDAADPTLWFHTDCVHANDRGHHELRRLIWKVLTGQ